MVCTTSHLLLSLLSYSPFLLFFSLSRPIGRESNPLPVSCLLKEKTLPTSKNTIIFLVSSPLQNQVGTLTNTYVLTGLVVVPAPKSPVTVVKLVIVLVKREVPLVLRLVGKGTGTTTATYVVLPPKPTADVVVVVYAGNVPWVMVTVASCTGTTTATYVVLPPKPTADVVVVVYTGNVPWVMVTVASGEGTTTATYVVLPPRPTADVVVVVYTGNVPWVMVTVASCEGTPTSS
jgi:hypothetical protein